VAPELATAVYYLMPSTPIATKKILINIILLHVSALLLLLYNSLLLIIAPGCGELTTKERIAMMLHRKYICRALPSWHKVFITQSVNEPVDEFIYGIQSTLTSPQPIVVVIKKYIIRTHR